MSKEKIRYKLYMDDNCYYITERKFQLFKFVCFGAKVGPLLLLVLSDI